MSRSSTTDRSRPVRAACSALAVTALIAVVGCGGDGDEPSSAAKGEGTTTEEAATSTTEATTSTATSPTTTTTMPTTTAATPTTPAGAVPEVATFAVGSTASYDDGSSVTVHGVTQPFVDPTSIIGPPPGSELVSVDVEVCAGSRPDTSFNPNAWTAYPAQGGALGSRLSSRIPAFFGAPLTTGSCNRGYVAFVAPVGTKATWIVWSPPSWEAARFEV